VDSCIENELHESFPTRWVQPSQRPRSPVRPSPDGRVTMAALSPPHDTSPLCRPEAATTPTEPPPTESPPTEPRTPAIRLQHTCLGVASCVWPCRLYVACSVAVRSTALGMPGIADVFHITFFGCAARNRLRRTESGPTRFFGSDAQNRVLRGVAWQSGLWCLSSRLVCTTQAETGRGGGDRRTEWYRLALGSTRVPLSDPRNSHRTRFFGSAS